jgi:hypothetical protein
MSYKTTYFINNTGNMDNYDVVLLQDTSVNTNFVGYGDFGNNYFMYKILSLNLYAQHINNIQFMYDINSVTNDYIYSDLPTNVFEDWNGYPIMETWYWNPPWHFEKVCMKTTSSGEIRYGVDAREGFEEQVLVYRFDKNDFLNTYSGAGGWHSQGWYIKDLDVENGVVSAILYKPAVAYEEVMIWDVTDEQFSQLIGIYWNYSYRGILIDNSW